MDGGDGADMKERIGGLQQWLAGKRRHLRVCDVDNANGRREQARTLTVAASRPAH